MQKIRLLSGVGPYDFRDAEYAGLLNPVIKTEFSLMRNDTEFVKVWMNSSKVGHYTQIKARCGLVFVNIKRKSLFKYDY